MSPLEWIRWRRRVPEQPTGDSVTDFARLLAWKQTPDVHRDARRVKRVPTIPSERVLYSVWVLHSALWVVAGDLSGSEQSKVDRFFRGYWPTVKRELTASIRNTALLSMFEADVEQLHAALRPTVDVTCPEVSRERLGRVLDDHLLASGAANDPARQIALSLNFSEYLLDYTETFQLASVLSEVGDWQKHLPEVEVAAAGGWAESTSPNRVYQLADEETMLRVVLEGGEPSLTDRKPHGEVRRG